MPLTVATWNVNSVRKRLDQVARFARETAIDVLCSPTPLSLDEALLLSAAT